MQYLLCGTKAQEARDDVIAGRLVWLFHEGPLRSRGRSTFDKNEYQSHLVFPRKESVERGLTGRYNTKRNQYLGVLGDMS